MTGRPLRRSFLDLLALSIVGLTVGTKQRACIIVMNNECVISRPGCKSKQINGFLVLVCSPRVRVNARRVMCVRVRMCFWLRESVHVVLVPGRLDATCHAQCATCHTRVLRNAL